MDKNSLEVLAGSKSYNEVRYLRALKDRGPPLLD
jgi:hypothetical protein